MSRQGARGPAPRPRPTRAKPPNLPQHNHPSPYSRLMTLGEEEHPDVYDAIEKELRKGDVITAIATLQSIALDETFYEYYEERTNEEDPRLWTRLHAVRMLAQFGLEAKGTVESLLPLLDEEDDELREEMPFVFAAIGEPALEPLTRLLKDASGEPWLRIGAGESLAEMGEIHPALRSSVVASLEETLRSENEDTTLCSYLVTNLLDLGAKESLPVIEQAFKEERVDETLVQMADVEEHFDLPRVSSRKNWDDFGEPDEEKESGIFPEEEDGEEAAEPQTPYVASVKVGRNELCPCGSGKKYKKCHGA